MEIQGRNPFLYNFTNFSIISELYRLSHETWQLVNSFECLVPYSVLDIEDFCGLFRKKYFTQIYFTLKLIFL